ncbi:uncharacterized protein LOC133328789 [Musca vetustissima]|uniref:uncharacterized protein LOC133328789 n=1 Tax=Musca vetustissima TaxID=27455 RepID=UPI002AB76909|nr:uncharacterized protein LOC133328789 [Musca vetustissima]
MATAIELSANEVEGLCQKYFGHQQDTEVAATNSTSNENLQLNVIRYQLKPISDSPSGFLGHHRFLVVDVQVGRKSEDGRDSITFNRIRFFTKAAPVEIASRMDYLEEFGVFKKEIIVYRDVLPQLQEIFAGVAPKCYYADNNLLVFEELQQMGYKMAAGRDGILDYEHLQCAVKTLATMHAASIVFEVKQNVKINEIFAPAIVENAYPNNVDQQHVRYQNFANGVEVFSELIKQMPKYEKHLDFILTNLKSKMSVIFELAQTSTKFRNVFSHGDLWANNVMFEYGKYGDSPIQCRFVDFQLARYAPPMVDLITLLTIPSTREFRRTHLMELLQEYYRFMKEFLKREQLNIEEFLSEEEFWQTFELYRICGLIESCLFCHLTILPAELTQCLTATTEGFSDFFSRKRVEICLKAFNTDEIYRQRLTDILEDLVDNFILEKAGEKIE